jgi:site-specific recombinase XerD
MEPQRLRWSPSALAHTDPATGCRISKALGLQVQDCDSENLLVTLTGKGRKQRKVPFSFELRKHLFRHTREFCLHHHSVTEDVQSDTPEDFAAGRIAYFRLAAPFPD